MSRGHDAVIEHDIALDDMPPAVLGALGVNAATLAKGDLAAMAAGSASWPVFRTFQ